MGTFKINEWGFAMAFGILFSACGGGASSSIEMVSKEKYEKKIEEYQSLNKRQAAIIDDNLEKSQVINNVVSELRQVSLPPYVRISNMVKVIQIKLKR